MSAVYAVYMNMKNLGIAGAVLCVLAGCFLVFRPADRLGGFGDGARTTDCQRGLPIQEAPVRYSVSLIGYYLTSMPIEGAVQNWGTCPYADYKAKTFAAEVWVLGAAFAGIAVVAHRRARAAGI
jgi:hypothetical protein